MNEPVYIIIPVYNRKPTTLACLAHLKQTGDFERYHIVIVDDGSQDGTAEAINQQFPEVIVLCGSGDLWWTGAISLGMQYAAQKGAEYLIWLNDDCFPAIGTLPKLVEFMRQHVGAIAAPTCYASVNGTLVAQHNGSQKRQGCAARPGEIFEVDGMSGWCVGIPILVFQTIGTPDADRFPHYSGDDTYIFRAHRAGFKAYLLGDLKATLVGAIHDRLGMEKYFRPGLSPSTTFQALFWNKKSPYRLLTKFFHCIERYGIWIGTCLFLAKLLSWMIQWAKFQMVIYFSPNSLTQN